MSADPLANPRGKNGRAPDVFRPGAWVPMRQHNESEPVDFLIVGTGAGFLFNGNTGATGNTGPTGSIAGGTSCESNALTDLSRPEDQRNWASVTSISIPSWWQPYVLSAGSLTPEGQASKFTMVRMWRATWPSLSRKPM